MSRDILLGRTRRSWGRGTSLGAVDPGELTLAPRAPMPTTESLLEASLAMKKPVKPSRSVERMVKDAVREGSPETMRLYEKYHPSYRAGVVSLRVKADPLKGG